MLYGPIFEYFDPKDGEVPDHLSLEFGRVAERARRMLAEWSNAAILDAGDVIDELILHTRDSRVGYMLDMLAQSADEGRTQTDARYESPAGELEWCMGRVDPASVADQGPLKWSELFAVQALALVAHGVEEQQHLETLPQGHEVADRNIGAFAVDAMEALAKAEVLCRVEELEQDFAARVRQEVGNKASTKAARAAKQRHAPQNRVKQRFIAWYLENQGTGRFHSRVQAADRFYRDLLEQEQRLFQPTNATRTLLDALRAHLRESPSKTS